MTADARRSQARRPAAATGSSSPGTDQRPGSTSDREADHAAIDRLADELVPALIAKLSATGLGEIEVGEGDWTVRVRRPADATSHSRRTTDRASRAQPGHAGHGHTPGGFEGHRTTRDGRAQPAGAATISSNGSGAGAGGHAAAPRDPDDARDARRAVVTSPAVGVFQLRSETKLGARVRSGDRLGAVDMLGVPQEVIAPADGIIGATLAEPGEAVEYGQELLVIDLASARTPAGAGGTSAGADA